MSNNENKIKEFESILNKFSRFVKINIQKFDVQKNGIDPEDISQEVKIKIWKILEDEKKIKNFASYIRKIINSSVIDTFRKLKREKGIYIHEKHKWISEQKSNYQNNILLNDSTKKIIDGAMESLIESRRRAVKLFLLNMTIEEIAIYLQWSKDKTRNLLYRGLSDLKKTLKEKGIELENKP
ncbi:MAG: RNA polymerase sigma factor [Candidatus Aminicenantes bacterium]|nr:MAG: RNA polymerase sigma factor [Candidatus Aminicenantes bacterium]